MKHTEECEKRFSEQWAAREAWVKLWPNHCKTCGGAGASYSTYDPSPAGCSLGSGSMTDVTVCEDCSEKGICSRCGEQVWDPDNIEDLCPKCGWDGKDHMPPEPGCSCYFSDIPEITF